MYSALAAPRVPAVPARMVLAPVYDWDILPMHRQYKKVTLRVFRAILRPISQDI